MADIGELVATAEETGDVASVQETETVTLAQETGETVTLAKETGETVTLARETGDVASTAQEPSDVALAQDTETVTLAQETETVTLAQETETVASIAHESSDVALAQDTGNVASAQESVNGSVPELVRVDVALAQDTGDIAPAHALSAVVVNFENAVDVSGSLVVLPVPSTNEPELPIDATSRRASVTTTASKRIIRGLRPALAHKAANQQRRLARKPFLQTTRPARRPTLRVLLIGNNYVGTANELRGCVEDVRTAEAWLRAAARAASMPIVVTQLADERGVGSSIVSGRHGRGTGAAILAAIRALVTSARAGDSLYVHYSGHGAGLATRAPDELARINSTWVPLDYATWRGGGTAGLITDNELRIALVNRVPAGCALWVTSDSCFSGSVLDLRFNYTDASFRALQADAVPSARAPAPWTPTPPPNGAPSVQFNTLDRATATTVAENRAYAITAANVVLLSGCKDTQTSADTFEDGLAQGALTWALFNCIGTGADARVPLKYLVKDVRGLLRAHAYTQVPQLSTGKALDVTTASFAGFLRL
jgi:hypothetical protein